MSATVIIECNSSDYKLANILQSHYKPIMKDNHEKKAIQMHPPKHFGYQMYLEIGALNKLAHYYIPLHWICSCCILELLQSNIDYAVEIENCKETAFRS